MWSGTGRERGIIKKLLTIPYNAFILDKDLKKERKEANEMLHKIRINELFQQNNFRLASQDIAN